MGSVMMSGVATNMTVPSAVIKASDIAVGSIVKLMEGGVATEYLVVNQGIPSGSSLYDASCDGMWLLRKDIKELRQWHSSAVNDYAKSDIHAYLNGDFFNLFGSIERYAIKQVKIPYFNGTGDNGSVSSGTNGISAKIFNLSAYEIGFLYSDTLDVPEDGAKLDYFEIGGNAGSSAWNKRIAQYNGSASKWGTRSPVLQAYTIIRLPGTTGGNISELVTSSIGVRPALILPSNSMFNTNTMILKGVA